MFLKQAKEHYLELGFGLPIPQIHKTQSKLSWIEFCCLEFLAESSELQLLAPSKPLRPHCKLGIRRTF